MHINPPLQASNLLPVATQLMRSGERLALLTLVAIEGSAPYPVGSQMLVRENGSFIGQISGGCAEVALADQAVMAIDEGQNQTHRYGLDSPFFDIQLPCGSGIDVFFDVSTPLAEYEALLSKLEHRQSATSVLHTSLGEFNKTYLPTERIALFGQGPILSLLAQQSLATGFEVVAFVQDDANLEQLRQSSISATKLVSGNALYHQAFDEHTAVVSLFHEHEREIDILLNALNSPCFYIGALGSRKTHQQRLTSLLDNGASLEACKRIFGPVGVNVGAETPAQIAISILAQIVAQMPKQRAK